MLKTSLIRMIRTFLKVGLPALFFLLNGQAFAAVINGPLPASVEPAIMTKQLSTEQASPERKALAAITQPSAEETLLGPEAKKITFKLTKIILTGNHTYTEKQLRILYQAELNKVISIADLQLITLSITNFYRNNGYILTRAILPPQHVENGVVQIRVIEGFIKNVSVSGNPKKSKALVLAYGCHIAASRPLKLSVMEYYLHLANEIPGAQVKAVLEPSKTTVGASDLTLVVNQTTAGGYVSYDNYGTRYIGPQEISGGAEFDSIFRSGDSTQLNYATVARTQELQYVGITYNTPICTNGMRWLIGALGSITKPEYQLTSSDVVGKSPDYYTALQYPLIRSRTQSMTLDARFDYLNSFVTTLGSTLYNDRLRTLTFGGNYNFSDSWNGANLVGLHAIKGLPILGATTNTSSFQTSRFGGTGNFILVDLNASRLQNLSHRFSAFFLAEGQYSFEPLLAAEQFTFGGSQIGRGYDPAEIIGDRGAAGTVELRMDFAPEKRFLQTIQLYAFYDAGVIWNIKNLINQKQKQSATSTGFGTRFSINRFLSGNLMIAQPLTRVVQADAIIGNGRAPRGFFSITALL